LIGGEKGRRRGGSTHQLTPLHAFCIWTGIAVVAAVVAAAAVVVAVALGRRRPRFNGGGHRCLLFFFLFFIVAARFGSTRRTLFGQVQLEKSRKIGDEDDASDV